MVIAVLTALTLAGCGSPGVSEGTATAPPGGVRNPPPPGQMRVSGAVRQPGVWTAEQLAALPNRNYATAFGSDRGPEHHQGTAVDLAALLEKAGFAPPEGLKNGELSAGVLVIGADGSRVLLSYTEVVKPFASRPALLALTDTGEPMARPWLMVPGVPGNARDVHDVVEVQVVNVAPTG
jgi:hypothetical protein